MRKTYIISIISAAVLSTSCGSGDAEKAHRDSAECLYNEVLTEMSAQHYDRAIVLMDSFSVTYPLQLDLRKALLPKRSEAVEGLTVQNIPVLDRKIAELQMSIDEQQKQFVSVKSSAKLPPYLVYKGCDGIVDGKCRLQARVNTGDDAEYSPWVLAVGTGRNIGLNRLQISTKQGAAYTIDVPVAAMAQASVSMERVAPLAQQLSVADDEIVSVTASGTEGSVNIKVSAADSRGIGAAWKLCATRDSLRSVLIDREKAERVLQVARDNAAAHSAEPQQN